MTFAARLDEFDQQIALIGEEGEQLSYADLARRADTFAVDHFGGPSAGKRLVLLQIRNDIESIVRYLGALRAGHAVILTGDDFADKAGRLIDTYRPDICVPLSGAILRLSHRAASLHSDLALCLSTSGSTGATKLVRLSSDAIEANAQSIVEFLQLGPDERAITSLPLHYSYGLSVLHSHLACGAAVILTERSVIEPAFWDLFRREGATSLAGVPHSFDLLDNVGLTAMDLPTLRYLTQAGGRLAPEMVRKYGQWARDTGRRMFVMYGQTEAAPRMAYLPPDRLLANSDCIGIPVPGGAFQLVDEDGHAFDGEGLTGELVYHGPNVMMGYAFGREDLAKGPETDRLRTGDLAQRSGDLYRIVGRRSRFCKPFGLRVSLDELEAALARKGIMAAVTGNDDVIAIACRGKPEDSVISEIARNFQLPVSLFDISATDEWPRLPSGKTDYQAILQAAIARRKAVPRGGEKSVADAFAALLNRAAVSPNDSFVTLEGDSLSYVSVASELDRRLGYLPEDWEHLTVAAIDTLEPRTQTPADKLLKPCDSEILLRALAVTGVVANHASTSTNWHFGGGADVLMLLVGFNLARFNFGRLIGGQSFDVLFALIRRVILPYCVILCVYGLYFRNISVTSLLMVSNFEGRFHSFLTPYWFMEALLQCTLMLVLLFRLRSVRAAADSDPFLFGLWFLAGAVALKVAAHEIFDHEYLQKMTPDAVLPLIACGWLLFFARTPRRKTIALLAAAGFIALHVAAPVLGGWDYAAVGRYRLVWLLATVIALLYVPRIPLTPWLGRAVNIISSASFTIYLVHILPVHLLRFQLHVDNVPLIVLVAMGIGVLINGIRPRKLMTLVLDRLPMRSTASATTD